ncbi:MAG: HEAT repeat domain-containing protein [bacterium]|nr:HEAT repeat domain-containing protein [bacterium]
MNDRKTYIRKDVDSKEMKKAIMFVSCFFSLLKAEKLYPSGHKMLILAIERFYSQLKDIVAQEQKISLRIFDNSLYFQNLPLDTAKIPEITIFLEKLHERYIRRIVFNTGTNMNDINALMTLLNTDPENISPEGGPNGILEKNGAQNIKIIEYYNKDRRSINQERLSSLTNSSIFQFLTDDSKSSLSSEQAYSIYELLKETPLICSLIKTASQDQGLKQTSKLSENANILEIVKKIKAAIEKHNISEKTEIKSILHDIIASNSEKDFFDLVFEHPDDEIINYTNVSASVIDKLGPQKTAEFMTQKIAESDGNSKVVTRTKTIINKLFKDRQEMLNFLPTFTDTLQKNIPSESKAKQVINDICSSIDPEYSLEMDTELSLGFVSDNEPADILKGLNVLKTVHLVKETMAKRINSFDQALGYFAVLEEFIEEENETKKFIKMLDKLIAQIKILFEQNNTEQLAKIMFFLFNLISETKKIKPEHKKIVLESLATLPLPVLEGLITKTLYLPKEQDIKTAFKQLFYLFPSNLMTLLINYFIFIETSSKGPMLREIIINNYKTGDLKFDAELGKAPLSQIMRLLDLLQDINSDDTLPFLWEITLLENLGIAKKSLKLIASKRSEEALPFLLKAVDISNIPLRITAIECLGLYNTPKVCSILVDISQGKISMTDSLSENIDIRMAALRSLELLDKAQAKKIFNNVMGKKRFFFIPTEPKILRVFAAERLKKLS